MEQLKIPKDRISVLIGKKGFTKRKIQKITSTILRINSEEGDVFIEGESLDVFNCLNIIRAISRGFNPEIALKLLDDDYSFEMIDIEEFSRNKRDLIRIKSRLIGTEGRARKHLEELTNTSIVVYGKTVSIIGKVEDLFIARESIEGLLRGSKHSNVYARIKKLREGL